MIKRFYYLFFALIITSSCKKENDINKQTNDLSSIQTKELQKLIKENIEKGDFKVAESYIAQQKIIAERYSSRVDIGLVYENLGKIAEKQGQKKIALENYLKSFNALNIIEANNQLGKLSMRIGNIYYDNLQYQKALFYYLEADKHFHKNIQDNLENIAYNYENISLCYVELKNYKESISFYKKAEETLLKLNLELDLKRIYQGLAISYANLKNYSFALNYAKKALNLSEKQNDNNRIARSYNNLGNIYKAQNNYSEAKSYLEKALSSSTIDPEIEATAKRNLGYVYLQEKDYANAEGYLLKSASLAEEANLKEDLLEACLYLSDLYKATGNATKALDYYKKYASVKEELNQAEQLSFVKGLNETIQAEQQAQTFLASNNPKDSVSTLPYLIGIGALVLVVAFLSFYYIQRMNKAKFAFVAEKEALVVQERSKEEALLEKLVAIEKDKKALSKEMELIKAENSILQVDLAQEKEKYETFEAQHYQILTLLKQKNDKMLLYFDKLKERWNLKDSDLDF